MLQVSTDYLIFAIGDWFKLDQDIYPIKTIRFEFGKCGTNETLSENF